MKVGSEHTYIQLRPFSVGVGRDYFILSVRILFKEAKWLFVAYFWPPCEMGCDGWSSNIAILVYMNNVFIQVFKYSNTQFQNSDLRILYLKDFLLNFILQNKIKPLLHLTILFQYL